MKLSKATEPTEMQTPSTPEELQEARKRLIEKIAGGPVARGEPRSKSAVRLWLMDTGRGNDLVDRR